MPQVLSPCYSFYLKRLLPAFHLDFLSLFLQTSTHLFREHFPDNAIREVYFKQTVLFLTSYSPQHHSIYLLPGYNVPLTEVILLFFYLFITYIFLYELVCTWLHILEASNSLLKNETYYLTSLEVQQYGSVQAREDEKLKMTFKYPNSYSLSALTTFSSSFILLASLVVVKCLQSFQVSHLDTTRSTGKRCNLFLHCS